MVENKKKTSIFKWFETTNQSLYVYYVFISIHAEKTNNEARVVQRGHAVLEAGPL